MWIDTHQSLPCFVLSLCSLPAALIQTITRRRETHADICLSTELQLTSLIGVHRDGREERMQVWGEMENGAVRLGEKKITNLEESDGLNMMV